MPIGIGDYVVIGRSCVIRASQIGSYVYIGEGSVIGSRCILESCSLLEPQTVLAPGTVVPPSFSELGAEILDSGDLEGSGLGRLRRPEKIVFLRISRGISAKNPPPAAENFAFWSPDFDDF